MASMNISARDIPRTSGRDSFAAVAARSVPVTKALPPPTPPNSISPNLPPRSNPYGTRSASAQLALEHVESDLDLQEGQTGSEKDPEKMPIGSPGLDTAGTITPTLLARHHLPEILLAHGPLAIRHIMGYLTTSVPGFSGIPPAKARRLVVGALEGRGSGGEGGGLRGDVKFEKVGWGRWDAKHKGRHARNGRSSQQSPPPSAPSSFSTAMPIVKNNVWKDGRDRLNVPGSSWAGDSAVFSHDDDMGLTMLENEADKMSLDGDEPCSSSEAPSDDEVMDDDDPDDITDDEDWAALGAAALRAASYSVSGPGRNFLTTSYPAGSHRGGGPSRSTLAKSVPMRFPQPNNLDISAFGMTSGAQERDAIEALLRLGSV
ncbi:putative Sin3 binding protein-domain-containing protein [Amylocarpus encephaloides]|uniref:Sin3 binding protein-domain-containing protein n=1 Tax=Amylocarpus encephaloides TaxID=45428 RepID=A0A9P8C1V5_9HELO|nr:putative Sin3 binding protein-domain-containing protein [Amylocarpus encephaloides]